MTTSAGRVRPFAESVVEEAALAWLESLGYNILHGPEIAPGEPFAEREEYGQVILESRLGQALQRLNPQAPPDTLLPGSSPADCACRLLKSL